MNKFFLTLSAIVLLSMVACDKDVTLTDSPLNPNNGLNVEQVDTFSVVSFTEEQDPLNGKNIFQSLLGKIDDSRVGVSQAALYSQLRLSINAFDIGNNPVLDSAILSLAINESYGPFTTPLDINIYEVTEVIDADNDYKNDTELEVGSTIIGSLQGYIHDEQTTLRIPMTTEFGQILLDQFDTDVMESSDNFLEFLNGIYVQSDANTGGDGMLSLDLTNENTQLELYFHSDNDEDSIYNYIVDNQTVTINQYTNDFTGSEVETYLNDNTDDDDVLFVAPMSSTRGTITIPDLSSLENTIVNKAEISFFQTDYASDIVEDFPEPTSIFLFNNVGDSSLLPLPDFNLNNASAFGGEGVLTSVNGLNTLEYKFVITEYVQQLIQNDIETEGLLVSVLSQNETSRILVGGSTHPDFPIKLNIIYTTVE